MPPVMPYQPMHGEQKHVSQDRMQEILSKNAARATESRNEKSGHTVWPKESQETRRLSVPPRSSGPLEWQKPEPGSMGRRSTDEWYSCCKIGQPDGSFKYEVWTREPLTSGMKQLALGLPDFETAKKVAQDDADKYR